MGTADKGDSSPVGCLIYIFLFKDMYDIFHAYKSESTKTFAESSKKCQLIRWSMTQEKHIKMEHLYKYEWIIHYIIFNVQSEEFKNLVQSQIRIIQNTAAPINNINLIWWVKPAMKLKACS